MRLRRLTLERPRLGPEESGPRNHGSPQLARGRTARRAPTVLQLSLSNRAAGRVPGSAVAPGFRTGKACRRSIRLTCATHPARPPNPHCSEKQDTPSFCAHGILVRGMHLHTRQPGPPCPRLWTRPRRLVCSSRTVPGAATPLPHHGRRQREGGTRRGLGKRSHHRVTALLRAPGSSDRDWHPAKGAVAPNFFCGVCHALKTATIQGPSAQCSAGTMDPPSATTQGRIHPAHCGGPPGYGWWGGGLGPPGGGPGAPGPAGPGGARPKAAASADGCPGGAMPIARGCGPGGPGIVGRGPPYAGIGWAMGGGGARGSIAPPPA